MSLPTFTCPEHSDFMPFAIRTSPTLKLIPAQPELDDQRLKGLLFNPFNEKEQWLKEAKEVLWEPDRVCQVSVPQLLSGHNANTGHKYNYYGNLFMYNIYNASCKVHVPWYCNVIYQAIDQSMKGFYSRPMWEVALNTSNQTDLYLLCLY